MPIEREDAMRAGTLGFMTRSLAIATMPHRDPKSDVFERVNGEFRLRMLAGSSAGLPYGSLPRLLVSWVCTEANRNRSPLIRLGDSLAQFLLELDLSRGGGPRGNVTRVRNQMQRLFGSSITVEYSPRSSKAHPRARTGFSLSNIQLVEDSHVWWDPLSTCGVSWSSSLKLSEKFYLECIDRPIPVDLRVYKALRDSPLALDIYAWLTYRMSYLARRSKPIPWEALQAQFGSGYPCDNQGLRNFRKAFLRELKKVRILYPQARVDVLKRGFLLLPSPTHVSPQHKLL